MQEQKILDLIELIKIDVDFNKIANYINATKGQLTKKNERHFASIIRDKFFQICSFSEMKYIDQNRADLFYKKLNQKIEIKYLTNGFLYSFKNKNPREIINEIKLINTDSKTKIKDTSDCEKIIILCCEPHAFSILLWSDLIKYGLIDYSKPGQIVAKKVPRELFYEIINYKEFKIVVEKFDLQKRTDEFIDKTFEDFTQSYNNLTKSSNSYNIYKSQKDKENNKMNIVKNGSTKKSYDLILNNCDHNKPIRPEIIQKLFENIGEEKSYKACSSYISRLCKSKKIYKKTHQNKPFYYINKKHEDYLDYLKQNKTEVKVKEIEIKDINKNFTNSKISTENLIMKILKSDKLSSEEARNKIINELI